MASDSRTHSRRIEGAVSSPANLYLLADNFGEIVRRSAPGAQPGYGSVVLFGVAELTGTDILSQLTQEERTIKPLTLQLPFVEGSYRMALSDRMFGSPVGFWVTIAGPDEVRVIGLAGKIGKDVERFVQKMESDHLPPPEAPAPTQAPAKISSSPAVHIPEEFPAVAKTEILPALTPSKGTPAGPPASQAKTRSGLARFVENPYTIATATGLIVWVVTNLPAVAKAVSSWWVTLIAQPWFAQGASIAVSVLAGIGSALVTNAFRRRRKN